MASTPISSPPTPLDQRFRGRARNTFLYILLPITLLAVIVMGSVTYFLARNVIQEQINTQLFTNLNNLAVDLESWLTTKIIRLDLTVRNETFREALTTAARIRIPANFEFIAAEEIILKKLSATTKSGEQLLFNDFFITTASGEIFITTQEEWYKQSLQDSSFFESLATEARSLAVYGPTNLSDHDLAIITSAPVYDQNNQLVAIVFGYSGSLSAQNIIREVSRNNPLADSYIITAENDFVGIDPYQEVLIAQQPSNSQLDILAPLREIYVFGTPGSQHSNVNFSSLDGNSMIADYTWLPSLGAGLVVEISTAAAFGQLNNFGLYVAAITGVLGVFVIVATLVGTQRLIQPLVSLTETAEQFAQGNWDQRAPVNRNDEIGQLSFTFNQMADDLAQLYRSLETQVLDRTSSLERRSRQLEATALVARETAAIRNLDEMLAYSAELISDHFDIYHTGIFLIDNVRRYAVLQAANSIGGQKMLAHGHKLEVGQSGVVGYVASTGLPRIALDVGADAYFFDNPDLPKTRSEMALPLKIRSRVIGVLDVQSTQSAAFSGPDVEVLQVLADQISLAIENARLLEQSQSAVEELLQTQGSEMRLGWSRQLAGQPRTYYFDRVRVTPANNDQIAIVAQELTYQPQIMSNQDGHRLSVPIRLRDQHLGNIVLRREVDDLPWAPEDLAIVQDSINQVAIALDNARLLDETQKRAEHEQTVSKISNRLSRAIDIDSIIRTAVRELGQLPNVADASIVIDPTRK
jgi:GAF domain-containing protein/HAMP domain-containing protein